MFLVLPNTMYLTHFSKADNGMKPEFKRKKAKINHVIGIKGKQHSFKMRQILIGLLNLFSTTPLVSHHSFR